MKKTIKMVYKINPLLYHKIKLSAKVGKLIASKVISDQEEFVAISKKGQVIRIELNEVPKLGRQTQGVKVMKLREGDEVASIVVL